MTTLRSLAALTLVAALSAATLAGPSRAAGGSGPSDTAGAAAKPGAVLKASPLKKSVWVPGSTRRAVKLTYATTDAFGRPTTSTGTIMLPKGTAPAGGWPVIAWAHGTSGLADACAPSRIGPALPARDWRYLRTWMNEGYAIVASDYAGLGTAGKHAYLDARTTAHSVVDMVKAARNYSRTRLGAKEKLARKWVALGQSQGGGGAIATASFATEFGGRGLDFRGAIGTGTPAYIELLVSAAGPGVLPVDASPVLSTYLVYILAGMRFAHPEVKIDSAMSATGARMLDAAERLCGYDMQKKITGTAIGELFSRPLASLPGFVQTAREYMGMPETSFEKPIFMANGLLDTDVPMETTALYAGVLTGNGADVTFRVYPGTHNSTMAMSLPDTVPFARKLFAD